MDKRAEAWWTINAPPRRDGGHCWLPLPPPNTTTGTRWTAEYLTKTSSSLWNNTLPTARLMLVIWQNCLLHHSAAGCWHSHRRASVISSHPGRWKVVYIEAERQYHMVAPCDRLAVRTEPALRLTPQHFSRLFNELFFFPIRFYSRLTQIRPKQKAARWQWQWCVCVFGRAFQLSSSQFRGDWTVLCIAVVSL